MRDRELLAIKMALMEWRHWLEAAAQPFMVWTDHKNLEYIRSAKLLNPRQARWALFFERFSFTITYRLGSHNIKPDALSRVFCKDESPSALDTVVPSTYVVGSLTWSIEDRIHKAQENDPDPGNGLPDCLFVPASIKPEVLQWAHTSKFTGHPGVSLTVAFLRRRFWWPTLEDDTKAYIAACPVCAQNKSSDRPSSGLLHPLSIPRRPWSHLALDFVTGLPPRGHPYCC